jgi:GH35 family endo-1,4-beta-xylanase
MTLHGHTLVWHAQTNGWFFEGGDKATITKRLQTHIATLVGRYKGKIRGWDVVNEAINDGGGRGGGAGGEPTENLRNSQWLQTLGPDFFAIAFKAAHEADPEAKLYYNDYNIENGAKHQSSMVLLKRLIKEGVPIFGVGIQGHWSTTGVPYAAIDKAIADYASLGLKVSITELDVTINGTSGGQFGPAPAGGGGGAPGAPGGGPGRRGGGAPGSAPAGAFLRDDDPASFFVTAPAAPGGAGPGTGPASRGAGGGRRGGAGGFGGRGAGAPPSAASLKAQADAYAKLFAIFIKHKDAVERVTFWGVSDRRSWRAGQNPLIFDGNNQRKECYISIVDALLHPDPNLAAPQ